MLVFNKDGSNSIKIKIGWKQLYKYVPSKEEKLYKYVMSKEENDILFVFERENWCNPTPQEYWIKNSNRLDHKCKERS